MPIITVEQMNKMGLTPIVIKDADLIKATKNVALFYKNVKTGTIVRGSGGYDSDRELTITQSGVSADGMTNTIETKMPNSNFLKCTVTGMGYKAVDLEVYHGSLFDTPFQECTVYDLSAMLLGLLSVGDNVYPESVRDLKASVFYKPLGDVTVAELIERDNLQKRQLYEIEVEKDKKARLELQEKRLKAQNDLLNKIKNGKE